MAEIGQHRQRVDPGGEAGRKARDGDHQQRIDPGRESRDHDEDAG